MTAQSRAAPAASKSCSLMFRTPFYSDPNTFCKVQRSPTSSNSFQLTAFGHIAGSSVASSANHRPQIPPVQHMPLVTDAQNRPLVTNLQQRPQFTDLQHRHLATNVQHRPLVTDAQQSSVALEAEQRSLVAGKNWSMVANAQHKPMASDVQLHLRTQISDTQQRSLASELQQRSKSSDVQGSLVLDAPQRCLVTGQNRSMATYEQKPRRPFGTDTQHRHQVPEIQHRPLGTLAQIVHQTATLEQLRPVASSCSHDTPVVEPRNVANELASLIKQEFYLPTSEGKDPNDPICIDSGDSSVECMEPLLSKGAVDYSRGDVGKSKRKKKTVQGELDSESGAVSSQDDDEYDPEIFELKPGENVAC